MIFFVFLIGLIIGSFANCFIWRLYKDESLWNRSYCPKCGKNIFWYDNIPVLSFLILKGRCRHCREKISWQYPVVETVVGFLFAISFLLNAGKFVSGPINFYNFFLFYNPDFLLFLIRDFLIIFVLTVIFIFDLRWMLIPDKLILPGIFLVFFINLFLGYSLVDLLVWGVLGFSFFAVQFFASRGKWIGGGDLRLGFFMGVSLANLNNLILALILAYTIGSVVGIGLILNKKKKWGSEVPLGVFLAPATIIALFFGEKIINWYFNFLSF